MVWPNVFELQRTGEGFRDTKPATKTSSKVQSASHIVWRWDIKLCMHQHSTYAEWLEPISCHLQGTLTPCAGVSWQVTLPMLLTSITPASIVQCVVTTPLPFTLHRCCTLKNSLNGMCFSLKLKVHRESFQACSVTDVPWLYVGAACYQLHKGQKCGGPFRKVGRRKTLRHYFQPGCNMLIITIFL